MTHPNDPSPKDEDSSESLNRSEIDLETLIADRPLIERLYARGHLSLEGRQTAIKYIDPQLDWARWSARILLALGSALTLSSFVYFFALNWTRISPFVKLYSLQALIALALVGAITLKERPSGQVSLMTAHVFVGIFLAVFGQIYQTGADAFQLFLGWGLLTLPWMIVSRSIPTWWISLVVFELAIILWWEQSGFRVKSAYGLRVYTISTLLPVTLLVLQERLAALGRQWAVRRWSRLLMLMAILGLATPAIFQGIIRGHESLTSLDLMVSIVLYCGAYWLYRWVSFDLWAISIVLLGACCLIDFALIRLLTEAFDFFDIFSLFCFAMITMGVFTLGVRHLRALQLNPQGEPS
jgi:uncharacterized membrane protein